MILPFVARKAPKFRLYASSALAVSLMMGVVAPAMAQNPTVNVAIERQPLSKAIMKLSLQTRTTIYAPAELVAGKTAPSISGNLSPQAALDRMLKGTDLAYRLEKDGLIVIVSKPAVKRSVSASEVVTATARTATPSGASMDAAIETVEEVIVTARRKEEKIIDVPVAVSAFSAQQLDERKIEGGSELLRAIPNVNFSKDNFTGYNFAIRGIGTKATSVTTDPAVAVSFNNTALLRNRLFEQEYFDVQRLEVLRGPQGTLYGRNATAGVVNMLPNLPELGIYSGELQGEAGNFESKRLRGMINIPVSETFALRVAGAWTQRDGYDYNTVTQQNVNGRDLWSARLGALWQPTDTFQANLLWEHFEEDDDRSRTGKQLCTRGETPKTIEWTDPSGKARSNEVFSRWTSGALTPGCQSKSLYSDEAYGSPNGIGFPVVIGLILATPFTNAGTTGHSDSYFFRMGIDPFGTETGRQSKDLREIATSFDPKFRAKNDVFQLNLSYDLTPELTFHAQSLYTKDSYFGSQDFFRMQAKADLMARKEEVGMDRPPAAPGQPVRPGAPRQVQAAWAPWLGDSTTTGGVFLDPQLGASDRLLAVDISQSKSEQWSQEFRLSSAFSGAFNFNIGANYLKFETEEDYYIISNAFTITALAGNNGAGFDGYCKPQTWNTNPNYDECIYIDPNPIDKIDGQGHNYYRSLHIAKTESWAVFGEGYFDLSDTFRLTAGLRYTEDKKTLTPVPTQLFGSANKVLGGGGGTGKGYPRDPDQVQEWGEVTGRLAIDWKPDVSFTDDTLVYASYSRGYKAGGANPAGTAFEEGFANYAPLDQAFDPEFVNAWEVGAKNAFLGGKLMLNANAFFYDYKDYQISQVIDRTNHNENFDAKVYGIEFESAWSPTRNFRVDATLGFLKTRIGKGEKSIDVMNRTQGNDDWMVMRPWPTSPATCIVPKDIVGRASNRVDWSWSGGKNTGNKNMTGSAFLQMMCPSPSFALYQEGWRRPDKPLDQLTPEERRRYIALQSSFIDDFGNIFYDPLTDAPNYGRGFDADLSGNELPNAPHVTFNVGAQYRIRFPGWNLDLRGDYYRQSDSYMRVYNTEYDKLKGWENANLSATLTRPADNLTVQFYVKNVFDDTPITDGYTGPDELGNFTNVFTLDPRIVGLSVRKRW